MECLTKKNLRWGVSDLCATLYMVCHPVITLHLISFLSLSYKYHDYHPSPLTSYYSTRYHNTSPLTPLHINTMTTSHSPADDVTWWRHMMTVEIFHPKAPVSAIFIFIAIFTCLPSCINLSSMYNVYIIQIVYYIFLFSNFVSTFLYVYSWKLPSLLFTDKVIHIISFYNYIIL